MSNGTNGNHVRMFVGVLLVLGVAVLSFDVYGIREMTAEAINIPTSVSITVCGDGITSSGEACDYGAGNNTGIYASSTGARSCSPTCASFGPYCGDGILQTRFGEQCDDGNNVSGDLCSASCTSETAAPPASTGSPTVGATPQIPGAAPGTIAAITPTKVVLRGKAYPNAGVDILLDGKTLGSTLADANADFLYTSSAITPGVASFGFVTHDVNGISSITTSAIFNVVQSAITTVSNIFIPPTIAIDKSQIAAGELLTLSGQSVPFAKVKTDIFPDSKQSLASDADATGLWALQVDTNSLANGAHTAKAHFEITSDVKSGFGRSVNFTVGTSAPSACGAPDLNGDTKVNLVDFSIFLLSWNTTDSKADFNCDHAVNLADFSIMLFNWTG